MWLRFGTGRPVRAVTIAFWAWCCAQLAAQGCTALLWIWDHASWHRRQAVRHWRRQHNQQGKRGAGSVRVVVCPLPSTRPWLNPIEPQWVHGKRAIAEPDRLCVPMHWKRGSMPTMAVRVKHIWSCPKRSLDSALATPYMGTGVLQETFGKRTCLLHTADEEQGLAQLGEHERLEDHAPPGATRSSV